jgi:hypothetical protein
MCPGIVQIVKLCGNSISSISRVKKLRESEGRNLMEKNLITVINYDLSHFKTNRMDAMQETTLKMPPKKNNNSLRILQRGASLSSSLAISNEAMQALAYIIPSWLQRYSDLLYSLKIFWSCSRLYHAVVDWSLKSTEFY